MNADQLRALQAPLKAKYRDEPTAALVTLRAHGTLGDAITCKVATALEIPLRGGSVTAEGDLDFRGTLGVSKEVDVGFTAIRLQFALDTDATPEQLETLLKLTKRYCVVYQTLQKAPSMSATIARS
jgi:hypothetical protein